MSKPQSAKGKRANPLKERSSFKWTSEIQMLMAEYLRENHQFYKNSLSAGKKINFLRAMKDHLELGCDEVQLKNGFMNFMKKYESVKIKLNSSGFGVDPEKDKTLNKGWILRICPYFDVLDEVLACRPNVTPPSVIATSSFQTNDASPDSDNFEEMLTGETLETVHDVAASADDIHIESNTQSSNAAPQALDAEVAKYVKTAFQGLKTPKEPNISKSALGIFSKIVNEKLEETSKVELEKMKMDEKFYAAELEVKKEANRIELLRVNSQLELDARRVVLEEKKLADKAEEREHELKILKMEQEFQLRKLELQRRPQ